MDKVRFAEGVKESMPFHKINTQSKKRVGELFTVIGTKVEENYLVLSDTKKKFKVGTADEVNSSDNENDSVTLHRIERMSKKKADRIAQEEKSKIDRNKPVKYCECKAKPEFLTMSNYMKLRNIEIE